MLQTLFNIFKKKTTIKPLEQSNYTVKTEFMRIHDSVYNEETNNCKNKSEAFADFILSNGAVNVDTIQIYFKDQSYTHQFIIWDNLAFDPTNEDMVYGINLEAYLKTLYDIGFTGMRLRGPYIKK